jgi:hypothetical protein
LGADPLITIPVARLVELPHTEARLKTALDHTSHQEKTSCIMDGNHTKSPWRARSCSDKPNRLYTQRRIGSDRSYKPQATCFRALIR